MNNACRNVIKSKNDNSYKIIFCNIAYMENYDSSYYENDIPANGGAYVKETKDALEKDNFHYCIDGYVRGFVETKYKDGFKTHKQPNDLHIEKIDSLYKKENKIDDVTVVFCAKHPSNEKGTLIVGWYKNAIVYRKRLTYDNRKFNLETKSENAFLLPKEDRNFNIPRAANNERNIGFGQSNIWYANKPEHRELVEKVIDYINKESIKIHDRKKRIRNELEDSKLEKQLNNVNLKNIVSFEYTNKIKTKTLSYVSKGIKYYKRNAKTAINALSMANYKCEILNSHKTFIRKKDGIPYTEAHHLIPMAQQDKFNVSLDIEENIVSLCSNCHNEIHYGENQSILLKNLFNKRKELLKSKGINITLEELLSFYQ